MRSGFDGAVAATQSRDAGVSTKAWASPGKATVEMLTSSPEPASTHFRASPTYAATPAETPGGRTTRSSPRSTATVSVGDMFVTVALDRDPFPSVNLGRSRPRTASVPSVLAAFFPRATRRHPRTAPSGICVASTPPNAASTPRLAVFVRPSSPVVTRKTSRLFGYALTSLRLLSGGRM